MSLEFQNDREAAAGDSLWHTTETQTDEPKAQTVDTGSEVHQAVRRMGRN